MDEHDCAELSSCQEELKERLSLEETLWRQRSKQTWLKEGDRNTLFFIQLLLKGRKIIWLMVLQMVKVFGLRKPRKFILLLSNTSTSYFPPLHLTILTWLHLWLRVGFRRNGLTFWRCLFLGKKILFYH